MPFTLLAMPSIEFINFSDDKSIELDLTKTSKDDIKKAFKEVITTKKQTSRPERFEVIDKESHVITKDNMTATYHSKPKETK